MSRNVRWYEERQDRASERADRFARRMKKLVDQQIEASNEARRTKSPKKRAALEERAFKLSMQVRKLGDLARDARKESMRYGKAKAKVGVYSHNGGSGWSDR